MSDMPWRSLRAISRTMVKRNINLRVEGIDCIPNSGPVIIAARHFHHLYDGCALLATIDRPTHVLVAGDWPGNPVTRLLISRACRSAKWPVVLRPGGPSKMTSADAGNAFRTAAKASRELFQAGCALIVFPEGYPNIDPGYTTKPDETTFLPFERGVVRLASIAAPAGTLVPIVPAGFSYERSDKWNVTLRFGEPITITTRNDEPEVLQHLESQVRFLSR